MNNIFSIIYRRYSTKQTKNLIYSITEEYIKICLLCKYKINFNDFLLNAYFGILDALHEKPSKNNEIPECYKSAYQIGYLLVALE